MAEECEQDVEEFISGLQIEHRRVPREDGAVMIMTCYRNTPRRAEDKDTEWEDEDLIMMDLDVKGDEEKGDQLSASTRNA